MCCLKIILPLINNYLIRRILYEARASTLNALEHIRAQLQKYDTHIPNNILAHIFRVNNNRQRPNIIKHYRDTTRRRYKVIRNLLKLHGGIFSMQRQWRNRRLKNDAHELQKEADNNTIGPI